MAWKRMQLSGPSQVRDIGPITLTRVHPVANTGAMSRARGRYRAQTARSLRRSMGSSSSRLRACLIESHAAFARVAPLPQARTNANVSEAFFTLATDVRALCHERKRDALALGRHRHTANACLGHPPCEAASTRRLNNDAP
eukprot:scaffold3418_cov124-Isochrysis_galbana.AAC.18